MKNHFDVLIIGGGPAGAACALTLSKANLSVAIVDKEEFPRDKVCGDAIPGPTFKWMNKIDPKWGRDLRDFAQKEDVHASRAFMPNGKSFAINWKAYSCNSKRENFDNFLMKLVKDETNVEVIQNQRLRNLTVCDELVEAQLLDGTVYTSKMIIGCDGANSVVRRGLGSKLKQHACAAVRVYAKGVDGIEKGTNEFYYLKNYLPGYLWVFPLQNGEANIGYGRLIGDKKQGESINLRETFEHILENEPLIAPRLKNAQLEEIKGFGLPMFSDEQRISDDRILLCGDAACLIDPLMGHGIDKAVVSGFLAGQHILKCFSKQDFSAEFNLQYDNDVYSALGPELKRSSLMMRMLDKRSWLINLFVPLTQNQRLLNWIVKKAKI